MFDQFNAVIESKILPLANKLSSQKYLKAIRDSFISLLPITLAGGIVAVLNAAPVTAETTNGFLLAWRAFADSNSFLFGWINALTLGAMSLYICIGLTYFLCRHYKITPFQPTMLSILGFMMLMISPMELGWSGKIVEISYLDGKGLIPAIMVAIFVVEAYHFMRLKNWGRIKLPDSVPASLTETFASLVPSMIIIGTFVAVCAVFNSMDTTLPKFIFNLLAPTLQATDSLLFTIVITVLVHIFWFFGIHDAALAGLLGPIRDGNLSMNAAAHMAGEALPTVFTTSFWVYFVIIGGCGAVLSLAILLVRSKSKQLRAIGRIGIVPSFFGISEPIIFGVPLMLNPIFFIPFILAATLNGVIAFLLISNGFIGKTFAMLSWNMPSVFGAFLSTMDINALFLIIGLIVLDMIVYFPFFKIYERQLVRQENEDLAEVEV